MPSPLTDFTECDWCGKSTEPEDKGVCVGCRWSETVAKYEVDK